MPSLTPSGDGSAAGLDRRAELSEFLRSRRARLKPADVGLPDYGRRRRVPGLRREELAQVAGVSASYYTQLEQGNSANVSVEILDSIARALRLTETEHAYLTHLAKPTRQRANKPSPRTQRLRPAIQQLLDTMTDVPAYVYGFRMDILGWNRLAAALFGNWAELPPEERNWGRLIFLSPGMREVFIDWEPKASGIAGMLRMHAGSHPEDPQLASLVGELSVRSEEFRRLWAAHEVRRKSHGVLRMNHPLVGELTLSYEMFPLPDNPDQVLVAYHAEPGSESATALRLLASWGTDATTPVG
ncbi:helix-turn-helix transcriptional regulator [Nonomuraea turcica]|uniref:helix-turn-helix transcriptional regulator n=1 Tax=Nonomuraea sp. G32 TaxID=3067274 RepID=UPI00273AAD1F|nr:helix-turn-helix transcriptional regulator [Nonomuraea sp. G32]MDP4511502.1 helix-turn-helix transcriptional regulator [Nonomuraea sp. G32]